jgi:hypothetical protein
MSNYREQRKFFISEFGVQRIAKDTNNTLKNVQLFANKELREIQ